ncbi:MAG: hypothetical protein WCX71_00320 [Candidatus Buchananbacteria bacterium]
MRKKILIILVLFFALTLSACSFGTKSQVNQQTVEEAVGVAETGKVIDLSVQNNQTNTTTPGDVLSVKFVNKDKNREYVIAGIAAASYVSLKDQKVTSDDKTNERTVTWLFKVEKTGQFKLEFNYGWPGKKVEKTFTYNILSQ